MAMTETRPAPAPTADASAPAAAGDLPGLAGWLTTSDHRRVGRLFIAASLLFLVVGGLVGLVLGAERLESGLDLLSGPDNTGGAFIDATFMHQEVAVLLFLVPLLLGIATIVVPQQVGSPEIALPRGSAAAFWLYLVSGALHLASYAIGGDNFAALDLWLLALAGILVATMLALVSLVTTVLTLRAPGMTLLRTPAFSWSIVVAGSLTLLTAPVLLARVVAGYVTHHFSEAGPLGIGTLLPYDQINWFWSLPHLYLLVVPVVGIALEIVPVMARNRVRLHAASLVLIGLVGVLGLGAWAQVPETFDDLLYVAIGLAAVIPVLAVVGLLGDTLRAGRPQLKAPLVLAMTSMLVLLLGTVVGALLAIEPLELQGTVWEAGHVHLVLLGAGALGGAAALWYWAPRLYGAELPNGAGLLVALTLLGGSVLLAVPDLVNGLTDDVALATQDFPDDSVTDLNGVSIAGGVLTLLGVLVLIVSLLSLLRRDRSTPGDPWGGHTLEWADSPHSAVTSATPLYEEAGA